MLAIQMPRIIQHTKSAAVIVNLVATVMSKNPWANQGPQPSGMDNNAADWIRWTRLAFRHCSVVKLRPRPMAVNPLTMQSAPRIQTSVVTVVRPGDYCTKGLLGRQTPALARSEIVTTLRRPQE